VVSVVDHGLAVASEEVLEVAHRHGKLVGDPGLWGPTDEAVGVGDLGVLDDQEGDGVVDEVGESVEEGELGRLGEIVVRGGHHAAPAT
jgi:hypothetical protein